MQEKSAAEIGQLGELLAVKWLRRRGYLIHHTNWRDGHYELDIVARKQGVLHFIEVKSRKLGGVSTPESALNHRKVEALIKAARAYLRQYRIMYDIQFDLIAIDTMQNSEWNVRFIENAIEFRW